MAKELQDLATRYPVVTLLGPRQSGKTTLVRTTFAEKPYVNLEELDTQEIAAQDPRSFLARYPHGAILDEVQRLPELLSYIQVMVDEKDEKGLFILTGSHQFKLHAAISQSLAGRTALLELLPMSMSELTHSGFELGVDKLLLQGGYPRLFKEGLNPTKAYANYFQTYVERDLRQLALIKELSSFQKCMRLLAGRIGQLVNFEGLSNEVGVSSHTVKEWLSLLEASFLIIRLQPYFENFGKRAVKAPKLYFTDVGLASYLLGIETEAQMARDPLRGALFENLIFLELIKERLNCGLPPNLYFYRDTRGHEVDFIFQKGRELIPIEVKAAQTFHSSFLKNLHFFQAMAGERAPTGYLIYGGSQAHTLTPFHLLPFTSAAQAVSTNS